MFQFGHYNYYSVTAIFLFKIFESWTTMDKKMMTSFELIMIKNKAPEDVSNPAVQEHQEPRVEVAAGVGGQEAYQGSSKMQDQLMMLRQEYSTISWRKTQFSRVA